MSKNMYANGMYSSKNTKRSGYLNLDELSTTEDKNPELDLSKPDPKAYRQLAGLKLSNSHHHLVELNGKTISVANSAYVGVLEQQVRDLRKELRTLQSYVRKMANSQNKIINNLNQVSTELTKKISYE